MSHPIAPERTVPDGRDRRWNDHREARRRKLLDAAVRLIDAEGGEIGVASICSSAGVPRSVVYKLFRDRDDLDEQIRQRIIRDLNRRMAPTLVPRSTGREIVVTAVRTYLRWVTEHPQLHQFLNVGAGSRPAPATGSIYAGKATFVRALEELIIAIVPARALPKGYAAHLANALVGMADATINAWLAAGRQRSSAAALHRFVTDGACSLVEGTAQSVGLAIDLNAPVASFIAQPASER